MVVADPTVVLFVTAFATAIVGAIVSWVAYQGYRRHASETMLYLAIGIALITISPFVVSYGVALAFDIGDAVALLSILSANILGLLAILYSLET